MFDVVGGRVVHDKESLGIPPFKNHLNNSKDKEQALKEIDYVVFLYKWNSDYKAYAPDVRASIISKDVFGNANYKPSKQVEELIVRFNEFQMTPLTRLYNSAEDALEYLTFELGNARANCMDLELTAKLLEKVDKISKSIESGKARAMSEQQDTGRVMGGGTIGHYEIPRK